MRSALSILVGVGVISTLACAGSAPFGGSSHPLKLSDLDGAGDPTRRASLRLCIEGLDSDVAGRASSAAVYYERAIQVDPGNPYAYLAMARHELDMGEPEQALGYVDRAEQLLDSSGERSPRVDVHIDGLRGAALEASGRDGSEQLARAQRWSPLIWGDGRLTAAELR